MIAISATAVMTVGPTSSVISGDFTIGFRNIASRNAVNRPLASTATTTPIAAIHHISASTNFTS